MNHNAITVTPSLPFRPLKRIVFIRPEVEEKSGIIFLSRGSKEMPSRGVVMAMSVEADKHFRGEVKAGDRVLFNKNLQFLADDQESTLIDCENVLAVLERVSRCKVCNSVIAPKATDCNVCGSTDFDT